MKSKILIGSAAMLSAAAIAWAAKDPVVMTVNGVDVPKSEFEYLYNKNSQQQVEAQPLEEYVGMFELYKMKVADAKAEGIDTTQAFLTEMDQYKLELAKPHLADSVFLKALIDEAYNRSLEEVEYNHIMLSKGRTTAENRAALQLADSIRQALLDGADFDELARKYSTDRSVTANGGHLGFIAAGRLPYSYETEGYRLKPGEISGIVESSAGYHIMKGGAHRPSRGSIRASHIMKMVRPGATPEMEADAKAKIDSIYMRVMENPALFEVMAQNFSDDQGSARSGGQIGWFVTGQMVPEFAEAAYQLEVGGISEPVHTDYGWHIIKKLDARGPRSKESLKADLLTRMEEPNDERSRMIRDNRDKKLAAKHKASFNTQVVDALRSYISTNGLDSAFYAINGNNPAPLFFIGKNPGTNVAAFIADFHNATSPDSYTLLQVFNERLNAAYDEALIKAEEDWLYANNADYRNLLNEYHDGSLLYEVSLRKVWNKAAQDEEGLQKYFEEHRGDYAFKEPKAKGILVQDKHDSVADLVKARYMELGKDSALQTLRKEFRNEAVADRLLASKGVNRFVDFLMFEGDQPEPNVKYPVYFILDGRLVNEPEELTDVKGAVTTDYQQLLDQNWTTELRGKYPVVRNDKELKKVKRR